MLPVQSTTFSHLPVTCLTEIVLHVGGIECTRNCSLVCRDLFHKMQQNDLWQPLCVREDYFLRQIDGSFKKRYQREYNLGCGRFSWRPIENLPYNLRFPVKFCMADGKLAMTRYDQPITIRDLTTNKQFSIPIKGGHDDSSLAIHNNYLVREQGDQAYIYDLTTKELVGTFNNMDNFTLYGSTLIKANADATGVEIFEIQTGAPLKPRLLPEGRHVSCIAGSEKGLFVGTKEGYVYVWDDETKTFLDHPITQHEKYIPRKIIRLFISDDQLLMSQTNDLQGLSRMSSWDMKTETKNHLGLIDNARFIMDCKTCFTGFRNIEGRTHLRYWDIHKNIFKNLCVAELSNFNNFNPIESICAPTDKSFFFYNPEEGTIKVCNFLADCHEILSDMMETWRRPFSVKGVAEHQYLSLPETIKNQLNSLYDEIFPVVAMQDSFRFASTSKEKVITIECYLTLQKFQSLTQEEKNLVYGELYHIIGHFEKDYWGCAEDAFHNRNEQHSTPLQRSEAIRKHLDKRPQNP